ncbi:hypothetical protein R6L23_00955 [Streptomyces sp. SR27]|nr:hypothetical protein [Streptomyces sp. SR27]MDV9186818.1 hypothetical protein [Streptomyces sp. SR27]
MAHEDEQPKAGQENRLSVRQAVVDWLMPAAAIVEFIEWVVTIWQSWM